MANVKFVPPRVPLVDLKSGQITREWYLLFASLFDGADGPGTVPDPVDDTSLFAPATYDNRFDLISTEIVPASQQNIAPQLDALELLQAAIISTRDQSARLDEIELFLAANPYPAQSLPAIGFGVYTPTLTNVLNITSTTAFQSQWLRVGATVTVSGQITIAPTAAAQTRVTLSLPVPSAIANSEQAGGGAFCTNVAGLSASIHGVANAVQIDYISTVSTSQAFFYHFTYRIL